MKNLVFKLKTFLALRKKYYFDKDFYLSNYADVAKSKLSPLFHYIFFGAREKRIPNPLFDPKYYSLQVSNSLGQVVSNEELFYHYLTVGHKLGIQPNQYLDENYVKERASNKEPSIATYLQYGHLDDFHPSDLFNNYDYYKKRPDVKSAGVPALYHYLRSGFLEFNFFERQNKNYLHIEKSTIARSSVGFEFDKAIIYSLFSTDGRLSEVQKKQLAMLDKLGFELFIVVAVEDYDNCWLEETETISSKCNILYRKNFGFDFGAWKSLLTQFPSLRNYKETLFLNDSVFIRSLDDFDSLIEFGRQTKGVSFATQNLEVKGHGQTYYFHVFGREQVSLVHDKLVDLDYYNDKDELINSVEVELSKDFIKSGLEVRYYIYSNSISPKVENHTLHNPLRLIRNGLPFVKAALFSNDKDSAGEVINRLELEKSVSVNEIISHLEQRECLNPIEKTEIYRPYPLERFNDNEFVNGTPIHKNPNGELVIDLKNSTFNVKNKYSNLILVVLHAYYIDNLDVIVSKLKEISDLIYLSVTTDSEEKRDLIDGHFSGEGIINFEVSVYENIGRDVYPFIEELKKKSDGFDYVLHLHSKKSLHNENLSNWLEYLLERLIGSREIFNKNLNLIQNSNLGVIFPKHHDRVNGLISWGNNLEKIRDIVGKEIDQGNYLNFPSGTMFLARVDVLTPLMRLEKRDFDKEKGQIDGTLAHAVERSILFLCAQSNYGYVMTDLGGGIKMRNYRRAFSFIENISRAMASKLLTKCTGEQDYLLPEEVYSYELYISNDAGKKNLFIPTVEPEKVYGGVTTALKVFRKLLSHGEHFRIVVTSDKVSDKGVSFVTDYFDEFFVRSDGKSIFEQSEIVELSKTRSLSVSRDDSFMATAWWTYKLAEVAYKELKLKGSESKILYLIQDYEPGFYEWGTKSALARSTYGRLGDFIPIVNSEELTHFFEKNFGLEDVFTLEYSINDKLAKSINSYLAMRKPKSKNIIVYARPSVNRNLFGLINAAIRVWERRYPKLAKDFKVHLVGEGFSQNLVKGMSNVVVGGKLTLDEYAELLVSSYAGISLMESPHPSYPPLEMAYSNVRVITNTYMNKDLSKRNDNIVSLKDISPESIASELAKVLYDYESVAYQEPSVINGVGCKKPLDISRLDKNTIGW